MKAFRKSFMLFAVSFMLYSISSLAQQTYDESISNDYILTSDILYGSVQGRELKLDLYMPVDTVNPPLLVYIHGGAWHRGSKEQVFNTTYIKEGYAMASVGYRLAGDARFPAQIHDIKAAIRFLRGNASMYGYNATRIAILGGSTGAHLATMVGVTNGHQILEGDIGDYLDQSSDVQAIVSYLGASNLTTILSQSTPFGLSVRVPALELLLGGQPEEKIELARLASPVFHIDETDPPLMILHGDQDQQMPINQSHELHYAYKQHDLPVQFEVVHGAGHGIEMFRDDQRNAIVIAFLDKYLR